MPLAPSIILPTHLHLECLALYLGFSSAPFHVTEVHFLTRDQQPFSKTERASIWDMNGDRDSNTSNQQCPSMKADVKTAKLTEVTCAELRGVTLEDLEEGKDYNQNI